MTVIARDGKTLAADKRCGYGASHYTTTKIRRIGDARVGCSGSGCISVAMMEWFAAGAKPEAFPKLQEAKDDGVNMLVVLDDGRVHEYGRTPYPQPREDKFAAIGSGSDFALAAMHLGLDAVEAVDLACRLDPNCGNGIDALGGLT